MAIAAQRAGHSAVGVLGRSNVTEAAIRLACPVLKWGEVLPASDLVVVSVRDDAIAQVARDTRLPNGGIVVHMSGMTSVSALAPLAKTGVSIGAFHPLQTLPDPERGANSLAGAWIAVTAEDAGVAEWLAKFAESLGARPFPLEDEQKPLYHAAAASASNYVVTVLALAFDLFERAGTDPAVARPLVEAIIDNVFEVGPKAALTGPIAREDIGTVLAQRAALAELDPKTERRFVLLGRMTAELAGTAEAMAGPLGDGA